MLPPATHPASQFWGAVLMPGAWKFAVPESMTLLVTRGAFSILVVAPVCAVAS